MEIDGTDLNSLIEIYRASLIWSELDFGSGVYEGAFFTEIQVPHLKICGKHFIKQVFHRPLFRHKTVTWNTDILQFTKSLSSTGLHLNMRV
jgi:hypothetical protein